MFELILQWVLTVLTVLVLLAAIAGVVLTIKDEWDMRH